MANEWQGRLVRLRRVEPDDWAFFFNLDYDSEMGRTLDNVWFPGSVESAKTFAREQATRPINNDQVFLLIETLQSVTVGTINSHTIDRRVGTFSYGIAVAPEHRGQGYASEAIILLLRHFFTEHRYQKVTASVFSFNTPSIRLHEKLGFTREAHLRRMGYTRGDYFDEYMYGMLAEEFAEKHPG